MHSIDAGVAYRKSLGSPSQHRRRTVSCKIFDCLFLCCVVAFGTYNFVPFIPEVCTVSVLKSYSVQSGPVLPWQTNSRRGSTNFGYVSDCWDSFVIVASVVVQLEVICLQLFRCSCWRVSRTQTIMVGVNYFSQDWQNSVVLYLSVRHLDVPVLGVTQTLQVAPIGSEWILL